MPSTRSTLLPMALLALAACGTEPSAPAEAPLPLPYLLGGPSLNEENGVILKVSGGGVVDFTSGGASLAPFQFVAWKQADGTVGGHFRQSRFGPLGTVEFEGVVTCVTVDPNFPGRARIAGVVTSNTSTDTRFTTLNHEVGDDVWFRVTSGRAGADDGDKSTTYGFKPTLVETSEQYCALPFDGLPAWNPGGLFPLANGQITIHQ
jgi:hypothetical protein